MMTRNIYEIFGSRWYREGGSIYLYSDPHFGDKALYRKRRLSDTKQIKMINSKLGKNDTIIFLGDIGDTRMIKQIRGYKVLVMGNHDKGESNYDNIFNEVYRGPLTISDKIILSHEPIYPIQSYWINIHGHCHWGTSIDDGQHVNVCAESINYTPVNLKTIIESGILKNTSDIHEETILKAIERKILNNYGSYDF